MYSDYPMSQSSFGPSNTMIIGIVLVLVIYIISFVVIGYLISKYKAPGWFLFLGFIHFVGVAIVLGVVFRPDGYADRAQKVNCPNCGGLIGREFTICPYCHRSTETEQYEWNDFQYQGQQQYPEVQNVQYNPYQPQQNGLYFQSDQQQYNQPAQNNSDNDRFMPRG